MSKFGHIANEEYGQICSKTSNVIDFIAKCIANKLNMTSNMFDNLNI